MAYTTRFHLYAEVVDASGNVLASLGTRLGDQPVKISAAGEEIFRATATVADNYTKQTLWTTGDGGVDTFGALLFLSDKAVLLELVEDVAGTPLYSTLNIAANVLFPLSSDDIANVAAVSGSETTLDVIDSIRVQRNVADAAGDASCTLILVA